MSVGNADGNGDELETLGVPSLYLGNNTPLDETLALSVDLVAKTTVDTVVQEAVEALAQAVADATQWFADAVRGELISQAVITTDPPGSTGSPAEEKDKHACSSPAASPPRLVDHLPLLTRPPSAAIHAVAKSTVDSVTQEAVKKVVRAVEDASEWIIQAVETELVSQAMKPDEGIAIHNATEWLTQTVRSELVAHAVADASPTAATFEDQQERVDTPEVVPAHDAPRVDESQVAAVRELAKATAAAALSTALQTVAQAIEDASKWLVQAVRDELVAQVVIDALSDPDDVPQDDEADNNSTDSTDLKEQQQQPSPSAEEVDESTNVPVLQLPSSAPVPSEAMADFAVPFVNDDVASALHEAVPVSSPEPQDEVYDDDYTPINTPTAEEAPSKSPLPSTRPPEQETPFVPPVILSGRATPPDTKPTPR
ncbi:hypothetical protein PF005_g11045 [Phytophthora fragariae]|uniref:Uncharacterized protein n=2 Tax=Phytophthora fragariae TaxID=53985 RepID=A0A6A3U1C6_9STRA|nr:hypothetical protein PF003_g34478 [Phytophthora fragariae]KAE8937712.1 hypothetical protein PF009_g12393 [Phytophthora fragariae]KAE9010516.1 hypothetical protein PF011_g9799 [Phytophthora fragariae]KAE9111987.1 hypothetical protein PF007_g11274 [Phytophthora fragariae]KAE9112467.1 hypothetical protein PF010_g10439 [Phytophthora fragariae]